MRTGPILFMLAFVALSGCADSGGDGSPDSTDAGGSDGDVDIESFDGCSPDATSMGIIRESSYGDPESGIIPEGTKCLVGFGFSWPNAGHTIEFSLGEDVHTGA